MSSDIHAEGRAAVAAFEHLPWPQGTRTTRGPSAGPAAKGQADCLVTFVDGLIVPVEIKKFTDTVSQVRPIDYFTLVIWGGNEDWWVVPPTW